MVAVAGRSNAERAVPVAVAAGEEASGLANMIGQYLHQILADSPAKEAEAAALRGRLGLRALEGDVAVTMVFGDGGIVIEEGLREPDAVISGEIQQLMHVLSGRANPAWELGRRRMAARLTLRRPLFGYQAYRLMRLPDVHLWSGLPRSAGLVAGAAAAATVAFVVWRVQRAKAGR